MSYKSLLLFDDKKITIARKPGKKQKENTVGCTGEGKLLKGNNREGKTRTVLELSLITGEGKRSKGNIRERSREGKTFLRLALTVQVACLTFFIPLQRLI